MKETEEQSAKPLEQQMDEGQGRKNKGRWTLSLSGQKQFRTALRVAAIGLIIDMVYIGMLQMAIFYGTIRRNNLLAWDSVSGIFDVLVLSCLALACLTLYIHRKQMPAPDWQLRTITFIAAIVILAFIVSPKPCSYDRIIYYYGRPYIALYAWQRCVILALAAGFLWKMSSMPLGQDRLSKSFSTALSVSGATLCVLLPMLIGYGIYVLCSGHVAGTGLGTGAYASWIKYVVPGILLSWYTLHILPINKKHLYRLLLWVVIIGMLIMTTLFCIGVLIIF